MSNLQVLTCEDNQITLNKNGRVYKNATMMAKDFGKQVSDWLNLKSTTKFLDVTSKLMNHSLADLLIVENAKNNQITWMQEDVALEFYCWLLNSVFSLPFFNPTHE